MKQDRAFALGRALAQLVSVRDKYLVSESAGALEYHVMALDTDTRELKYKLRVLQMVPEVDLDPSRINELVREVNREIVDLVDRGE